MPTVQGATDREAAVSSIVGTVLMLSLTVTVFTAVGIYVLDYFEDQPRPPRADIDVLESDTRYLLQHKGGQEIDLDSGHLVVNVQGVEQEIPLTAFADQTTDGLEWRLGESLCVSGPRPPCYFDNAGIDGAMLVISDRFVVAREGERGTVLSCPGDTNPPTVSGWTQTPSDVTSLTVGTVTVAATVTDGCYGEDPASSPHLWWRSNDGSSPAYADAGAMTSLLGAWSGTVPAQAWSGMTGQSLQYYVSPLVDRGQNSGASDTQTDTIQLDCSTDLDPPTVQSWERSPSDVRADTLGAVTVTVTVTDGCAGVDESANPTLYYRINDGSNPAYTSAGMMTSTGTSTWEGSVPDPTWAVKGGQSLQHYATGMRDANGNTYTSTAAQTESIDVVAQTTYVDASTATTGTLTSLSSAQSAGDSGAEAQVSEGAAGSTGTMPLSANAVVSSGTGWGATTNGYSSNNAYATNTNNNPGAIRYGFADPASSPGALVSVALNLEQSVSTYTDDRWTLQACLGATCSTVSGLLDGSLTDTARSYDVTSLRPGGGAWSWSDLSSLEVIVTPNKGATNTRDGTWRIDHAWVDAGYSPTYSTSVELLFSGVPIGSTQTLELSYRTASDTFTVEIWDGSAWTARGTTLTATSATAWSYVLTSAEYVSGSPRLRVVDATPGGAAQGQLYLDYARVVTT